MVTSIFRRLPLPHCWRNPTPSTHPIWLWDASLYKGRYYLYWGPVPALLLLLFKGIARYHGTIIDQWPTLLFMLGRLYAGAAIILRMSRYVRTRMPAWFVGLSILIFGLASPTPFIVARPHIYEACLAAGQCFLFWGLYAALCGIINFCSRYSQAFGYSGNQAGSPKYSVDSAFGSSY